MVSTIIVSDIKKNLFITLGALLTCGVDDKEVIIIIY